MSSRENAGTNPPGIKRVSRPDGTVYLYAWRGRGAPRLYEPEHTKALWDEWREAIKLGGRQVLGGDVASWLERWRASADFQRLALRTQLAYESYISRIREKFGRWDPLAFTEREMRPVLLEWRDTMADTPAAADNLMVGLRTFLSWLQDRGVIGHHVAGRIKRLNRSDRADLIWTEAHRELWRREAPSALVRAMEVARLTALAAVDLVRVEWTMFDVDEIELHRQKTGELALIPILDELREIVAAIPRSHERVLVNARGDAWSERGLSARFCEWTKRLEIPRTLHDLRGTAVTELCLAGLDDRHVAEIAGWSITNVSKIRRRYVGRRALIRDAVTRLEDHRKSSGKVENRAA